MPSAAEQNRRNEAIVAAHATGKKVPALAEEHGLSKSRIKEVLAEARTTGGAAPATATIRAADARRTEYAEVASEVRRLAAALPAEQASAKVGALRLCLDALDRLTKLDQALGYLPRDLEHVGDERALIETTAAVFRDHGVSEAIVRDWCARVAGEESAA